MDIVVKATVHYLSEQVKAGVEIVQLFDSWAGILDPTNFEKWVIAPTKEIITEFKKLHPDTPIIGFPRGAGMMIQSYIDECDVQGIGLDYTIPPEWALEHIPKNIVIQGNLDPVQLLVGGASMEKAANNLLEQFKDRPFIFNLGHGVIKETPVAHVEKLSQIIKDFKK